MFSEVKLRVDRLRLIVCSREKEESRAGGDAKQRRNTSKHTVHMSRQTVDFLLGKYVIVESLPISNPAIRSG